MSEYSANALFLYAIAVVAGVRLGWLFWDAGFALTVHFRLVRWTRNRAIAVLVVLASGLPSVAYVILFSPERSTGVLANLTASFLGAMFFGACWCLARMLYRPAHRADED